MTPQQWTLDHRSDFFLVSDKKDCVVRTEAHLCCVSLLSALAAGLLSAVPLKRKITFNLLLFTFFCYKIPNDWRNPFPNIMCVN